MGRHDHFDAPRNVGAFDGDEDGVVTGIVGAPECGDVMKLQLKIGAGGIIEDARFKSFGCGSTIASASFLTEYVKGRSVDEAIELKGTQICEELCLPPAKIHCSTMAEDALRAAISAWRERRTKPDPQNHE